MSPKAQGSEATLKAQTRLHFAIGACRAAEPFKMSQFEISEN